LLIIDCKTALRISTNNELIVGEIEDLISAARQDLILSGILPSKANNDNDPLIKRAIIIYCKANYGFDNPDSEKLQNSYNLLKASLALSSDYIKEGDTQ
jgi:uncharacterized phage protein (predicted DNA packaging)